MRSCARRTRSSQTRSAPAPSKHPSASPSVSIAVTDLPLSVTVPPDDPVIDSGKSSWMSPFIVSCCVPLTPNCGMRAVLLNALSERLTSLRSNVAGPAPLYTSLTLPKSPPDRTIGEVSEPNGPAPLAGTLPT